MALGEGPQGRAWQGDGHRREKGGPCTWWSSTAWRQGGQQQTARGVAGP